MSKIHHSIARALLASVCVFSLPLAAHAEISADDLMNLSLAELTNLDVTSVSKKSEKATEAAAAVFVITSDDIRRMGATSIPEALRVVPGLSVAQSGSASWAVSARGFNDQFANKLLVLIDGRTVYTPLFNGVWWDAQDVVLEDIERIEVIRGPGATLWGANAVNGVINVITKSAKDTQGGLVSIAHGNHENALTTARYGAKIGDDDYVRLYVKYNDREENKTPTGFDAHDDWRKTQAGFRSDLKAGEKSSITLQGDVYSSDIGLQVRTPSVVSPPFITSNVDREAVGFNTLGRWTFAASSESEFSAQAYVDYAKRSDFVYDGEITTLDFDAQHAWSGWEGHEVIYGVGYRFVKDEVENTFFYQLNPTKRNDSLFSAFLQDKIAIVPKEFFLTLGSKFEFNDYTGLEYQPSARLTWLVSDTQTLWSSVSRAVKTPYRNTDDASLVLAAFPPGGPVGYVGTTGNRSLESEEMIAYEVGYRFQPTKTVSVDTTAFYNDYDSLSYGVLGAMEMRSFPGVGAYAYFPVRPINANEAKSYGFEVASNWEVTNKWQISASYSFLHMNFLFPTEVGFSKSGRSPEQQFNIRSTALLPYDLELNNALYYVDQLPGIGIDNYLRFDTRLAWKPMSGVELSLVGQNLLDPSHPEFSGFIYQNTSQVPRSVYGNVTLKF